MDKRIAADNKRDTLRNEYSDYTIGLVLLDAVPVFLFLISGLIMFSMYDSYVLLAGVISCFLGGMAKVIWKLIVVVRRHDISFLTRAFRVLMLGGFGLMILSVLLRAGQGSLTGLVRALISVPACFFFIAGIIGMCVMGYLGSHMDSSARSGWIEELTNTAAQTFILIGMVILYLGTYYHAGAAAAEAMITTDEVHVTQTENVCFFDGPGEDVALVFYPGAKVEASAYAPIMKELAEHGVDCFLCSMPGNIALLDRDIAGDILDEYGSDYDSWYIAGHSLGGATASMYLSDDDADDVWDGIIFLASYPTDELNIPALSIYGSEDHVLNMERYEEAATNGYFISGISELVIDGGNHAEFGDYGSQKGDGEALIPAESQWEQTAQAILEWVDH